MPSLLGEWPDWGVKKGRERGRKGERQGGRKDEEGGEKKGTEGVGEENKCESEFLFLGWLYKHIYNFFFPPWMFPHQGSNPCPLQWKHGVITIGLPGDFLLVHLWPGYKGTRTSGEPSSSFRFEDHMRNPGLHFELSVFQSSPKFVSKPILEKTAWGGQDRESLCLFASPRPHFGSFSPWLWIHHHQHLQGTTRFHMWNTYWGPDSELSIAHTQSHSVFPLNL